MTTENKEDLATQETQDSTEGTKQEESQSTDTQETDWQARYTEEVAAREKVENDLRSERGRRTQGQAFQELVDEVGGLNRMITAVANRTASGETDALAGDIATITQTTATQQATRGWEANYKEAEGGLADVVMNDAGDVVLSKEDIATLTPLWQRAQADQDMAGLYRVISQAGKMVRAGERAQAVTALKQQKDKSDADKKASDLKHGIGDMSLGAGGGAAGEGMSWAQAQKSTDVQHVMDNYDKLIRES